MSRRAGLLVLCVACGARTDPGGVGVVDASSDAPIDAPSDAGARDAPDSGSVDPDLVLWLRADVGLETTSAGAVSTWRDQSGHQRDAVQTNAAWRPQRNAVTPPAVVGFDGVDDHLAVASGFADFTTGLTAFVFARTRKTTPLHAARFFDFAPSYGSLASSLLFVRFGGGDELLFQTYQSGTVGPYVDAPGAVVDGSWIIYSVVMSPGAPSSFVDATLFTNGVARATAKVHPPDVTSRGSNFIARSNLGAVDTWLAAEIAELRLYRRALGASERSTIEAELHARWKR